MKTFGLLAKRALFGAKHPHIRLDVRSCLKTKFGRNVMSSLLQMQLSCFLQLLTGIYLFLTNSWSTIVSTQSK